MLLLILFTLSGCSKPNGVNKLEPSDIARIMAQAKSEHLSAMASPDGQSFCAEDYLQIDLITFEKIYVLRGTEIVDGHFATDAPIIAVLLDTDFQPQTYYNLQGWSKCGDVTQAPTGDCLAEANDFAELAFVSFGAKRVAVK